MMDAMEETLYQHGVDAVFAGHVHAYESSYPVFRSASLLLTMAVPHEITLLCCPLSLEPSACQARCDEMCLLSHPRLHGADACFCDVFMALSGHTCSAAFA